MQVLRASGSAELEPAQRHTNDHPLARHAPRARPQPTGRRPGTQRLGGCFAIVAET